MKIPPVDTVKTAEQARRLAIDWHFWQSKQALSIGELADYHAYFLTLANKFNLTDEFRENGII